MKKLLELYLSFMKIGGFTLGGGYAMIPIIQHEAVDIRKWVSEEEITDLITISQSLPGVISINTATGIGYKVAGFYGALAATLGMITPSFVVIIIIALIFDRFQSWTIIQRAFQGVRAAIAALLAIAVVRMTKTAVKNPFQIIICILSAAAILIFQIWPPVIIVLSGICALAYKSAVSSKGD